MRLTEQESLDDSFWKKWIIVLERLLILALEKSGFESAC